MRCDEIMKKGVECVSPQTSVQDAACRMRDRNVGFLPVCHPDGTIAGTLTDRDIAVRLVAGKLPGSTEVGDIMSKDEIVCCRPDDDLRVAEDLMARGKKSRILCVDEHGKPVGVISLSDISVRERDGARAAQTLRQVSAREAHAPH